MRSSCAGVDRAVGTILAAAGCVVGAAAVVRGDPVQMVIAIVTHAPTSPRSALPMTIPGGAGAQADPRFSNLNVRSYHAPSGSVWVVGASTNLSPSPNVVVIGSGLNILGNAIAARDGVSATTTGDVLGTNLLQSIPRINAAGQWAMASGSSAGGQKIIRWNGTSLDTLAAAGDTLPGGAGMAGGTVTSANILNDGSVLFGAVSDATGTTANGPYGAYSTAGAGSSLLLAGTTVAGEQPGGAMLPWTTVNNLVGLTTSADGAHWLVLGRISGVATVAVDSNVKVQVGTPIAGSAFASAVGGIGDAYMEANGDWYAVGTNADGAAWAVRNGVVIASSGQPIVEGSAELWKANTAFQMLRGSPIGYFVLTGTTDNADTSRNMAIVLNGLRVLARLGDPVDLNADGTFTGSLYLHTPQDKGTYCADGYYYFSLRLKAVPTGTTTTLGNNASFLRVRACPADFGGNGVLEVQDIFDFLNVWFSGSLAADFNRSGGLQVQDIFDFLNAWFAGC